MILPIVTLLCGCAIGSVGGAWYWARYRTVKKAAAKDTKPLITTGSQAERGPSQVPRGLEQVLEQVRSQRSKDSQSKEKSQVLKGQESSNSAPLRDPHDPLLARDRDGRLGVPPEEPLVIEEEDSVGTEPAGPWHRGRLSDTPDSRGRSRPFASGETAVTPAETIDDQGKPGLPEEGRVQLQQSGQLEWQSAARLRGEQPPATASCAQRGVLRVAEEGAEQTARARAGGIALKGTRAGPVPV